MKLIIYSVFSLVENTMIIMYLHLFLKKKEKFENRKIIDIGIILFLSITLNLLHFSSIYINKMHLNLIKMHLYIFSYFIFHLMKIY